MHNEGWLATWTAFQRDIGARERQKLLTDTVAEDCIFTDPTVYSPPRGRGGTTSSPPCRVTSLRWHALRSACPLPAHAVAGGTTDLAAPPRRDQYSSGSKSTVDERSASVMIQTLAAGSSPTG